MKQFLFIVTFIMCISFIKGNTVGLELGLEDGIYHLNSEKSLIEWVGKKVKGQHNGTVQFSKGELTLKNGQIENASFLSDMTTIVNLDLEDEKWNTKLINHLKSDDFFSVEKHPTAEFKMINIKQIETTRKSDPNYEIEGILTIKGISNTIKFISLLRVKDQALLANANIKIDRTLWDIQYGSGKFFQGLGDRLIDDNFELSLNITFEK